MAFHWMADSALWPCRGKADENNHSAYLRSLLTACASDVCLAQTSQCFGHFHYNVPQMSVSLGTCSQDTDIAVLWATGLKSLELVDALA